MIVGRTRPPVKPLFAASSALLVLVSLFLPASLSAALGDYSSHEVTDTGLVVIAGSDTLVFSLYAADVLRVDFLPAGAQGLDSTYAVIRSPSDAVGFDVSNRTAYVELKTSSFTLRIDKYPVRLTYSDGRGAELLAEPASGGLDASGASRSAGFELPPDLHLYGTGERGIGIDLRGYGFSTYNSQVYGYSGPVCDHEH